MAKPQSIFESDLAEFDISDESRSVLIQIRTELDREYSERFLEMAQAINRQAAALERIQNTLAVVIEAVRPDLAKGLPVGFASVPSIDEADHAGVKLAADPIGMGFVLSQEDIARALRLNGATVSELIRGLKLRDDPDLAVAVRRGGKQALYNYHQNIVETLRDHIHTPPAKLSKTATAAMARARGKMGLSREW